MKKALIFYYLIFSLAITFADSTSETEIEKRLQEIKNLYLQGKYQACLQTIEEIYQEKEAGKFNLTKSIEAELNIFKALLIYSFRDENWEKQIKDILIKAIETDLNYELKDFTLFPSYILNLYQSLKKDYLALFSKSNRRHSIGLYGVVSYLPNLVSNLEYIKPGLHYSFNFDDYLSLLIDFEFPFSLPLFNSLQVRSGLIWSPSFRVEQISLGLGIFYALYMENFKSFYNIFTIEGCGELILRSGIGFGASVELLRLDLLIGEGTLEGVDYVDIFLAEKLHFVFANLRIYIFLNF